MRFYFAFLLIALAAVAVTKSESVWQPLHQYVYHIKSSSVTAMRQHDKHSSGILMKSVLTIDVVTPDKLTARLTDAHHARMDKMLIKASLPHIPEKGLHLTKTPVSESAYEILLLNGTVQQINTDKKVSTWEVNLLKGIVGQLQVSMKSDHMGPLSLHEADLHKGTPLQYKIHEDSIAGNCEVLYDLLPEVSESDPKWVHLPHETVGNHVHVLHIRKSKNYKNCRSRSLHTFAPSSPKGLLDAPEEVVWQYSINHIVATGRVENLIIQESDMRHMIEVKSRNDNRLKGIVYSNTHLNLVDIKKIEEAYVPTLSPEHVLSINNLMYMQTNDNDQHLKDNIPIGSNRRTTLPADDDDYSRLMKTFVIPESNIQETPNNMLMSYLMASKSTGTKHLEGGTLIDMVEELVQKISKELMQPDKIASYEILEQFLNLRKLTRVMSTEQLFMLIHQPMLKLYTSSPHRSTLWHIVRDAIFHAGTEASLPILGYLIQKRFVSGLETVKVFSEIPKVVRTPTATYVQTLFRLIQMSIVTKDPRVHVTAIVSFGELLRHVAIDAKSHNGLSPDAWKILKDVNVLYIPHLEKELNKAMEAGHSPTIQTYIIALGLTGQPSVISIFKQHLEGQELTKHQRLVMIASLATVNKLEPIPTRSILSKIYINEYEDHEARCMAAHLIIMSNPPLMTLQRMARMTNTDKSEQVNAVVKSSIESLANLRHPEWSSIILKAQMAKKLLTPKEYGLTHSMGIWKDVLLNPIIHRYNIKTIGSVDTDIPKIVHFGISTIFDRLEQSSLELKYAVSSVKQLVGHLMGEKVKSNPQNDKIAEMLKFREDAVSPLEGNVGLNSLYLSLLLPFDNHTIDELKSGLENYLWNDQNEFSHYLFNFDVEVAFPMENGLPFFYEMNSPLLTKLNFTNTEHLEKNMWKMSNGSINAIMAHKLQTRFGFATPFEKHQYISAVDLHSYMRFPIKYDVKVKDSMSKQTLDVKLTMNVQEKTSGTKLVHFAIVPMSAHKNIWDITPLSLRRQTRKVPATEKISIFIGQTSIAIHVEDEDKEETQTDILSYLLEKREKILETHSQSEHNIFNFEIILNPEVAEEKLIDIHLTHDMSKFKSHLESHAKVQKLQESILHKLLVPHEKISLVDNVERKEHFQKRLTEGNSVDFHMLDIALEVPIFLKGKRQIITIGAGNSKVDSELKILTYWNLQSLNKPDDDHEICLAANVHTSKPVPLNTHEAVHRTPKQIAVFEVQSGKNCKGPEILAFIVRTERSHNLKKHLLKSEVLQMCQLERAEGNKGLLACQKTNELAELRDRTSISIVPEDLTIRLPIWSLIRSKIEQLGLQNLKSIGRNGIIYERPLTRPDLVSEPLGSLKDMIISSLHHSPTTQLDFTVDSINLPSNLVDRKVEQHPTNFWCSIDKTKVITLDGRVFPLKLGNCWHVVLISHPDHSLIVQTRKLNDKSRELKVLVDEEKSIHIHKLDGKIKVTINKEEIVISGHESYKDVDDKLQQTIIEIMELPDDSISFISEKYGIEGVFDGEHILIHLSDKHRSSVRGLCGDYNQDIRSDFTTPDMCVAKGPEDLVDSYALPDKNCPSHSIAKHCELSSSLISVVSNPKNVTHSQKSEEKDEKPQSGVGSLIYVTKVLELVDEICFSTQPVPICKEGTVPIDELDKPINMHCLPKTKDTLQMKKNIQDGAMPNLTYKSVSKTHMYPIPYTCGVVSVSEKPQSGVGSLIYVTKVLELVDEICFSTQPVPICKEGTVPIDELDKPINMHCLPKTKATLQMKKNIQDGAMPNLTYKSVSKTHMYPIPYTCGVAKSDG